MSEHPSSDHSRILRWLLAFPGPRSFWRVKQSRTRTGHYPCRTRASHGRKGSPTSIPARRFRSADFTKMAGTLALSGGCCVTSRTNQQLRSSFSTSKQQSTRKRWNTNQVSGNATGLSTLAPQRWTPPDYGSCNLQKSPVKLIT